MGRTFGLLVCAFAAFPSLAVAQRFDDVGVRAQGMAGAFVAVADDSSATWWNPAGLATGLGVIDLSFHMAEDGGRGFAVAFPSLGLSYYRLKISTIQPSSSIGGVGSSRQDNGAVGSQLGSQFGATFGQSITEHLVVATTVKLVNAQGQTQADLDIGAMAALGVVRLGVTVRDVRGPTFGSGAEALELSRRGRAGVAVVTTGRGSLDGLVLSMDADLNAAPVSGRDEQDVTGGVETWWLGRRLGVRGGAGANVRAGAAAFGAVGVTVVPYPRLSLEGALTRGSDSARDRWSLGLRLTF